MLKYILKRLGLAIIILLGVSMIIYGLIRMMPVQFVENKINEMNNANQVPEELKETLYQMYGIDNSGFLGVVRGYLSWLGSLLRLDFGTSFVYALPVTEVIAKYMPTSFAVALIATFFEFMIAIPLGITAATHQYSFRDYLVSILAMIGISLPSFLFGQLLKKLFAMELGWFPSSGSQSGVGGGGLIEEIVSQVPYFVLPILTVVILSIGPRMRMTRTNMLEVMNSDYIRTARAKGLKESVVINKHAFRNTLIPLVTTLAGLLPSLFSGAIITEQVFDLQGIGNKAYEAMMKGDIPLIMGYNMFLAMLSVLGVLLSDLMYVIVDPRVKLE